MVIDSPKYELDDQVIVIWNAKEYRDVITERWYCPKTRQWWYRLHISGEKLHPEKIIVSKYKSESK